MNEDPGSAAGFGTGAILTVAGHVPGWVVVLYAALIVAIFVIKPVLCTVLDHVALVDLGRRAIAKAAHGGIVDAATLVHELRMPRRSWKGADRTEKTEKKP